MWSRKHLAASASAAALAFAAPAFAQTPPPAATPLTGSEAIPCVQNGSVRDCSTGVIVGSIPPVQAGFNGIKCDGSTDDAPKLNALVAKVEAAGGGTIMLPVGTCVLRSAITVTASGVHFVGQGQSATIIDPIGAFNAISFSGNGTQQDGGVEKLSFNSAGLTGYDIFVSQYARTMFRDINSQSTDNFMYNASSNSMQVTNVNAFNVRGSACFYLQAGGTTRSDVMDFTNVTCGGATGSTYVGLVVDGFVNTVDLHGFLVSAPTGGGLLYENAVGAASNPTFFFGHDFQVEQAAGDGIHLGYVTSVYCTNCYSSSNSGDGVYVDSHSSDINFANPMIELNHKNGIETYASNGGTGTTGTFVTGGNVSSNSSGSTGTYSNVLVGAGSYFTTLSGVNLSGGTVDYGVLVQSGASYVDIDNDDFVGNLTSEVDDLSGGAVISGGIGRLGSPLGLNLTANGGTSGAKQISLSNPGTTSATQASLLIGTGTSSAYLDILNVDGATPTAQLATGAGDSGGLSLTTASGPITFKPSTGAATVSNPGTTGSTVAAVVAATGTANAYAQIENVDGAAPYGEIATGAADTNGFTLTTAAGPITLIPHSGLVSVSNPGTTGSTQAAVSAATGTFNAYTTVSNTDGTTPYGQIITGSADAGGLNIQSTTGPITLKPPSGQAVVATQPVQLQSYTVATLPSCTSSSKGWISYVTDGVPLAYGMTATGGGSSVLPVFCTGSYWQTTGPTSASSMSSQVTAGGTGGTTYFMPLVGILQSPTTIVNHAWTLVPAAGLLRNLYITLLGAPGTGNTMTATVYVDGSATAITCTVSGAATGCSDTTHTNSISAGHYAYIQYAFSASATTSNVYAATEFDAQ